MESFKAGDKVIVKDGNIAGVVVASRNDEQIVAVRLILSNFLKTYSPSELEKEDANNEYPRI